jgi:DUF4097 and DUF4098 domain-containing protein YvlB
MSGHTQSDANLTIKVPKGSSIEANLVSANLHTKGIAGAQQLHTVSGNVAGVADGDVAIGTVSGDVRLSNAATHVLRIKTTSGNVRVRGGFSSAEIASVSGDVQLELAQAPDASVYVQTLSGDINNCAGPRPTESRHGPGHSLQFDSGKGGGHVRIDTTSGDVSWCAGAAKL